MSQSSARAQLATCYLSQVLKQCCPGVIPLSASSCQAPTLAFCLAAANGSVCCAALQLSHSSAAAAQPGVWILHSTHPTAAQPALLFKITLQPPCSHVQPIAKVVVLLHVHMLPCRLQIACITCRLTKQVIAGRSQKRLSSMGAGGEKRPGANARVDSWRAPKDRDKQRSAAQAERVVSAARYQGPDLELAAQLER